MDRPAERPSTRETTCRASASRSSRFLALVAALAIVLATLAVGLAAAPPAEAAQPAPGHTGLVPSTPRTNTPRIATGEIWDIEVVGQRVFIAATFTSLQNTTGNNTAVVNQRFLASPSRRPAPGR